MLRRFNYTGRKKILRNDVTITLTETEDGLPKFYAELALAKYNLPNDAKVLIEAYDRNTVQRFPYGSVANVAKEGDTTLSEFRNTDSFLFRIKVVDYHNDSLLLALAKSIPPLSGDDKQASNSLLKVGVKDLGSRPWALEYDADGRPVLFINNAIDRGISLARSEPYFQATVFPKVVEDVLIGILSNDEFDPFDDNGDDEDSWKIDWVRFVEALPGVPRLNKETLESTDEKHFWVQEAVNAFCRKNAYIRKLRAALGEI